MQTGFFGRELFLRLSPKPPYWRFQIDTVPEVDFTHTGFQRILPKISVSLPGTATGDITPHCPPPLEGGGRSAAKDVSRDGYLWVSNRERPGLMVSIM